MNYRWERSLIRAVSDRFLFGTINLRCLLRLPGIVQPSVMHQC
ncbi:MAG TPA: hypothetical protein V6C65_35855 [Allocoleopsis sp.]